MNRWVSSGSSDGVKAANREQPVANSSTPDEPMVKGNQAAVRLTIMKCVTKRI
jgi:hypothetical protein